MGMPNEPINILIVEDNPPDAFLIKEMLRSSLLNIKAIYLCERVAEANRILREKSINLILLDLSLPDSMGINSILEIKESAKNIPVIVLTGLHDSGIAFEALQQSAQDYLIKEDINISQLTKSIEYSIERKKAEDKVIESEEKYRQMFYNNPVPAWVYDLNSLQVLEVNEAAINKYGYQRADFLKLTVSDLWCYEDVPKHESFWYGTNKGGVGMPERLWKHKTKNGGIILVEGFYYPIKYFGKTAMQMQVNDVTEKITMERKIELNRKQIVEAVFSTQENERKVLGEELHDNINQLLATVLLYLDAAIQQKEGRVTLISKGLEHTKMAIEEIRKLSKQLVLPRFGDFGLKRALDELVETINQVSKMDIFLDLDQLEEAILTEDHKITLYRIIQEQLNNILKYASARHVTSSMFNMGKQIDLLMEDDGKGFVTNTPRKGIGINNIISRAELFNGKVEIISSPGEGCRLKVILKEKMNIPYETA
jgi:two-component system, NarL family, sensor histidine kinase UhpB